VFFADGWQRGHMHFFGPSTGEKHSQILHDGIRGFLYVRINRIGAHDQREFENFLCRG
jgi:hypothetical protein